jgi:hypothetical protein
MTASSPSRCWQGGGVRKTLLQQEGGGDRRTLRQQVLPRAARRVAVGWFLLQQWVVNCSIVPPRGRRRSAHVGAEGAALYYMDGGVGWYYDCLPCINALRRREGGGDRRTLRQQALPQSCHQKGCGDVSFHHHCWSYIVASRRREDGGDRRTLRQHWQVLPRAARRVAVI